MAPGAHALLSAPECSEEKTSFAEYTQGFIANQRAGTTETGGLVSHNTICPGRDSAPPLTDFGITGGTGKTSAQQVCECVASWMAESARPFQIINDRYVSF